VRSNPSRFQKSKSESALLGAAGRVKSRSSASVALDIALAAAISALLVPAMGVAQAEGPEPGAQDARGPGVEQASPGESGGQSGQEASAKLEDVVVTSQFREQAPIEVPIAVTAYDQGFLDDTGLDQFDSLSAFVPGLLVQEQSVNNPGFVIRGITSDDGASNIEPRVSVFQNGVSISRSRGSFVELFDLERIEVLKGPQGTLFGRSAQIGAVHVISAKPVYRTEASAEFEFGNFDQRWFEAMVNTPLVGDALAFRAAATYRERDGFIDNTAGGDLNGTETAAIRASLRWDISPMARFDLIGNYSEDTPPGTSFKSGVIPALGGDTDPTTDASLNTFGGLIGDRDLGVDREIHDITGILELDLAPAWRLTSTTAYREFDSLEVFDPDGSALDLFLFAEDASSEQFSSELRFNYQPGERFSAFFGGGFFSEEGSQRVPLGLDAGVVQALFGSLGAQGAVEDGRAPLLGDPTLAQVFLSGDPAALEQVLGAAGIPTGLFQQEQFTNFSDNDSFDLFADISYEVVDGLTLTAGGRYTRDEKETLFSAGVEVDNPFVPLLLVPPIDGRVSSNQDPDIGDNFDGWAWRFVANYEWSPTQFTYFNHARGRRPEVIEDIGGEVDPAIGQPVNFEVVPDETVDSFELGYKGLFMERRLQVDLAAYYYDYENFQTTITLDAGPGQPPDFQLVNAGTATAKGFESQLTWRANDNISLYANYAWNESRFDRFDSRGNPQLFGDNRFRLSPDHTASFVGRITQPVGPGVFYVVPSLSFQSKIFFEDENQREVAVFDPATGSTLFEIPRIGEDDYTLVNVRGGFEFWNGQAAIEAFVSNLFDKDYIIDGGNTGGSFGIPTFIAGPPRFWGASFRFEY